MASATIWTCKRCFTVNEMQRDTCYGCESLRPESEVPPSSSATEAPTSGPITAADTLARALETQRERAAAYEGGQPAFLRSGAAAAALMPAGVALQTPLDHTRWHLIRMILAKLARYCTNWPRGHRDSIHDIIVYAAMLEALDEENSLN